MYSIYVTCDLGFTANTATSFTRHYPEIKIATDVSQGLIPGTTIL